MSTPIAIELTARLDKYLSQLGGVKDLTAKEIKGLQAQLSRDIKSAENAARAATEQQKKLSQSNRDFVSSAGEAGAGAKKLRGLVGQLGGEYASVLGLVDDVGDAVEVFGGSAGISAASAGVLAAAVAALAVTYQAVEGDIARYDETSASLKRTHDSLIPSERALRDAQLELAIALGTVTTAMGEQERARNAAADAVTDFGKAQEDERAQLRKSTDSANAWLSVIDKDSVVGGMVDAVAGWSMTLEQNEIRNSALNRALVEQHDLQKDLRETTIETKRAEDDNTAAKDRATAATERLRKEMELLQQTSEAMQRDNDAATGALAKYEAGLESLRQTEDKALARSQGTLAEIEADRLAARNAAAATAAKAIEGAGLTASAEEEIHRQLAATQEAIDQEAAAKKKKYADEAAAHIIEVDKKIAEEEARIYETRLSATSDLFGAMSSAFSNLGSTLTEDQKDAQMALFVAQQLAAAAQAAVNTELAVSQAAASAPPPYNAIPIAAAYATGIASEVAIATTPPPSFADTPGPMRAQGAGQVTVAGGDYFAAARNPEDLRRQVNGASDPMADYRDGGGSYAIVGARAYGRRISDDIQQRTPLSTILAGRRDRPLGRRA